MDNDFEVHRITKTVLPKAGIAAARTFTPTDGVFKKTKTISLIRYPPIQPMMIQIIIRNIFFIDSKKVRYLYEGDEHRTMVLVYFSNINKSVVI